MCAVTNVFRPYVYENSVEEEEKLKELFDLIIEEARCARKLLEEGKTYVDYIEDSKDIVFEEYMKNKENGISEKENIEELTMKFPKLTKSSIKSIICYKKNELKKEKANREAEEFKEYIIKELNLEKPKEEIKEDPKEKVDEESNKNRFKILKEVVIRDIAGEFGTYHIENGKISIDGNIFTTEEGIKEHYSKEKEILEEQIKRLDMKQQETIDALNFGKES